LKYRKNLIKLLWLLYKELKHQNITNRMNRKLVIALICCPIFLFGQQTVKVKKWMENSRRTESYEVLKSDRKIRHGRYQQNLNNLILEDGYYKNGLKDSLWQGYNLSGSIISSGVYQSDQQIGKWNFYNRKGVLEQIYDFTDQKLVYYLSDEPGNKQKDSVLMDNDHKVVKPDRPALFVGGTEMVGKALTFDVKIPREAFNSRQTGKVVISVSINEKGEVTGYEFLKSYGYGLDEEVLRVVKTLTHWLPAISQGKEIASKITIPYKLVMTSGKF